MYWINWNIQYKQNIAIFSILQIEQIHLFLASSDAIKYDFLFQGRKYYSHINLYVLYISQFRLSMKYCSHIWDESLPSTLNLLDPIPRRANRHTYHPHISSRFPPLGERRGALTQTATIILLLVLIGTGTSLWYPEHLDCGLFCRLSSPSNLQSFKFLSKKFPLICSWQLI